MKDKTKKLRILSVDDDDLNQIFIKEVLSDLYDVMPVMDGEEALEVMNTFKPDVILLDVIMPGMSGYDVCRAIRHTPNHDRVKIIFTSAKTRPKEREEGYTAGGDDYITKPFSYDELVGKINMFSKMQSVEDEKQGYIRENAILQAHIQLLEFMNHARRHYSGSDEVASFGKKLLHEFVTAFGAQVGLFLTTSKNTGDIEQAVLEAENMSPALELTKLGDTASFIGDVLMSYRPLRQQGMQLSPTALGLPESLAEIHSMLGISFSIDDQNKGALYLINKSGDHAFSDREVTLMESLIIEVEHVFRGM